MGKEWKLDAEHNMLKSLELKFGDRTGSKALSIEPSAVTLFVGPNNSGKSLALQEIENFCQNGQLQPNYKILANAIFEPWEVSASQSELQRMTIVGGQGTGRPGTVLIGKGQHRAHIQPEVFLSVLQDPQTNTVIYATQFARPNVVKLDGISRLALVNEQAAGDLSGPYHNPLQAIWRDNDKRRLWRQAVYRAFKLYPSIDPTQVGTLRIKLATREPTEDEERTWKACATEYHAHTNPIQHYSDGVKAFAGIMLQIIAGEPELILLDEPEAFLHPSLSSLLGREITNYLTREAAGGASTRKRKLIVSTHNPEFLMGCVQAKVAVNIVRLTYESQTATARLLHHSDLTQLMRKPILRSSKALSGLFYNAVIVTEADADRALYQELNERLVELKPEWGIESCLFVNANGKDTLSDIAKPLRGIGIPTAIIVDLDVLKQGGTNWSKFLDACMVPSLDRPTFELSRASVHRALSAANSEYQREGGIALLAADDRESADNLLSRLAEYGLFVVPVGEPEFWLSALDVNRGKHTWLREIFEKLGENPTDPSYVKPTNEDVWKFLSHVKGWLSSPQRKGI